MIHKITITAVLNGYIVNVGCQTVVFQSVKELTNQLSCYLTNPELTEKVYCEKSINKSLINQPCPAQEDMSARGPATNRQYGIPMEIRRT